MLKDQIQSSLRFPIAQQPALRIFSLKTQIMKLGVSPFFGDIHPHVVVMHNSHVFSVREFVREQL